MKFSEFAKTMYNAIGNGEPVSEFLHNLIDQIMESPTTDKDKSDNYEDNYNPLSGRQADTINRYFSGTRNLPQSAASKIISHLDTERFIEYIASFPMDTQELIYNSLPDEMKIENKNIPQMCADLFVSILKDCNKKGRTKKQQAEEEQTPKEQATYSDSTANPCKSNEEIFDFFEDGLYRYGIKNFIEHEDPTVCLYFDYIINCEQFIKIINDGKWVPRSSALIKETYTMIQKVKEFSWLLDEYIDYMSKRMRTCDNSRKGMDLFVPLYRDENVSWALEFGEKVKEYRFQLLTVYSEICNIVFGPNIVNGQ